MPIFMHGGRLWPCGSWLWKFGCPSSRRVHPLVMELHRPACLRPAQSSFLLACGPCTGASCSRCLLRIGDGTAPERIGVVLTAAVTAISSINVACAEGLA